MLSFSHLPNLTTKTKSGIGTDAAELLPEEFQMSMSNISIVGNLARAPEQICFASGKIKTVLVVAVDAQKNADKSRTGTDFYRVETWGRLAELAQKYLDKGQQIGICGRLIMEHWTDREGKERLTPVVSATQLSFPQRMNKPTASESARAKNEDYDDGGDLFEGARAITVAEPPAHYFKARPRLHAVRN